MTSKQIEAGVEGETTWYVGTMNDGYFVIDKPPQPGPVDFACDADHEVNVIVALGSNAEAARLLVAEHNAKIALASGAEYRVVWQREGRVQQVKRYAKLRGALLRHGLLVSDEPWEYLGKKGADYVCCNGRECGCGGETYKSKTERIAKETPLMYARIDARVIGPWKEYELLARAALTKGTQQ